VFVPDSQAQVFDRFKRSNGSIGKEFSTMTKSKGVGRGGARPNSGPKKKPTAGPTQVAGAVGASPIIPAGLNAEELKKVCEALAYETLATIARDGASENARVAASRELLDRSQGKSTPRPAAKLDQLDLLDDGWGSLLKPGQPVAGRSN
jgi:hypothetical protein